MHEDSTKSYLIKDIKLFGSPRRILLQSANGPCPLLAICNVLLLRNQIRISSNNRYISFQELVEMVSNFLFDANAGATTGCESTSSREANLRENMSSSLEILPRLNVGLDVNCRFSGPTEFEYTSELAVFDLLDICLYHGWVVSEQDEKSWKLFGHLTYNQIVERLIAFEEAQQRIVSRSAEAAEEKGDDTPAPQAEPEGFVFADDDGGAGPPAEETSERREGAGDASAACAAAETEQPRRSVSMEDRTTIEEGILIKDFMDRTASQLSYEGLLALHGAVNERQLAVFFRNSHFSTLLKYSGELYLLCTDIAFSNSHVVWERLDEVDGDTSYCDADFRANTAGSDEAAAQAAAEAVQDTALAAAVAGGCGGGRSTQEESDALLARQLMEQDLQAQALADAQRRHLHQQQGAAAQHPVVQGHIVGGASGGAGGGTAAGAGAGHGGGSLPSAQAVPVATAQPVPKGKAKGKKSGKSCVLQ